MWKKYLILMLACAGIGIITGSLFRSSYFDALEKLVSSFGNYVINQSLYMNSSDKLFLFFKIVIKRIVPFILLWLLAETVAGRVYMVLLCGSSGYVTGFWGCFLAMLYGGLSVRIIVAWYFPQVILYVLAYLVTILYITGGYTQRKKVLITLLTVILIAGCALEAYINPICLRWAFG